MSSLVRVQNLSKHFPVTAGLLHRTIGTIKAVNDVTLDIGKGEIVGVMKDFHFASLHNVIEPLVLDYEPDWASYLLIKFQGNELNNLLFFVQVTLKKVSPDHLFQYLA